MKKLLCFLFLVLTTGAQAKDIASDQTYTNGVHLNFASGAILNFIGGSKIQIDSVDAGANQLIYSGTGGTIGKAPLNSFVVSLLNSGTGAAFRSGIGAGDASTNTTTSIVGEIAVFADTAGKTLKRATGSGLVTVSSGVMSAVTAPAGAVVGTSDAQNLTGKSFGGGQVIANVFSASAAIDFASVATLAQNTQTITVTGVATTNTPSVSLGWSAALESGIVVKQAWVSSANTVSITVVNTTAGTVDPASLTVRATVTGF